MYYYSLKDELLVSETEYGDLQPVDTDPREFPGEMVNIVVERDPALFRRSCCVSDPSLVNLSEEGIHLLKEDHRKPSGLPPWLAAKIEGRQVRLLNRANPRWQEVLTWQFPSRWRVNLVGLGDVGSTLAVGLRLLGGDSISHLGIYARQQKVVRRWEHELNQIGGAGAAETYPEVVPISQEELFDCDLFVFCASGWVPPVGAQVQDVRMAQLETNGKIVSQYAQMAREKGFAGIFAVVSDPVDLLCKEAFLASNRDQVTGRLDFRGLAPEQVRGYGLGVMHARACYYARRVPGAGHYPAEGRAYGPHGRGLVIADSVKDYDQDLSQLLTEKTLRANLEVRELGFKPFIAPALSSGALSLLATIRGQWHYSASFLGGVYMGAKNRLLPAGTELERLDLPDVLYERLGETYERLKVLL